MIPRSYLQDYAKNNPFNHLHISSNNKAKLRFQPAASVHAACACKNQNEILQRYDKRRIYLWLLSNFKFVVQFWLLSVHNKCRQMIKDFWTGEHSNTNLEEASNELIRDLEYLGNVTGIQKSTSTAMVAWTSSDIQKSVTCTICINKTG